MSSNRSSVKVLSPNKPVHGSPNKNKTQNSNAPVHINRINKSRRWNICWEQEQYSYGSSPDGSSDIKCPAKFPQIPSSIKSHSSFHAVHLHGIQNLAATNQYDPDGNDIRQIQG